MKKTADDESGKTREPESFISYPATDGEPAPLGSTLVRLHKLDDEHVICEEISGDDAGHAGPVQVSSPAYRSGWEKTFGRRGVN